MAGMTEARLGPKKEISYSKETLALIDKKRAELGITNEELGNMTITSRSKVIGAINAYVKSSEHSNAKEVVGLYQALLDAGKPQIVERLFCHPNFGNTDFTLGMNDQQKKEYKSFYIEIMKDENHGLSSDDWDCLRWQMRDAAMSTGKDRNFELRELYESAGELQLKTLAGHIKEEKYLEEDNSRVIGIGH